MNIIIPPLDSEQEQAVTQLCTEHNQQAGTAFTNEEYLASVMLGIVNDRKRRNIITKGEQIIAAAQSLPDEKRLQFTAEVEQAYASQLAA